MDRTFRVNSYAIHILCNAFFEYYIVRFEITAEFFRIIFFTQPW